MQQHPPPPQQLRPFALVEHPALPVKFVITDCPSDRNLEADYIPSLLGHGVKYLIRLCDPAAYDPAPLARAGIVVNDDMVFEDGTVPSNEIMTTFRDFLDEIEANSVSSSFMSGSILSSASTSSPSPSSRPSTSSSVASMASDGAAAAGAVAVHCVSGIGRAPVLVAAALVDAGVDPLEAVERVRKARRGALNKKQLEWVTGQGPGGGLKKRKRATVRGGGGSVSSRSRKSGGGGGSLLGMFRKK
ncbi:protein-tyrosine phosphatase-like protein [Zopfochytrium polystomum]|nr:protein-tyrosine phosphatase-like protein [Zopfochytrium polystomum]